MIEKFDIYDMVTTILHGTLFVASCIVLSPKTTRVLATLNMPETISATIFICTAYFAGQVITAISSIIQPFLFWTWGGKPSDRIFVGAFPESYLSPDFVETAIASLRNASPKGSSNTSLFSKAMAIARKADGSLSERHNRMYAYNRVALVNTFLISLVFIHSCFYGLCMSCNSKTITCIGIGLVSLVFIHWYRAKQRAFYYVREVLVVAERELAGGV